MRKLILLAVLPMACLLTSRTMANIIDKPDSMVIHTMDGNLAEWRSGSLETDSATNLQYAVDHDAGSLYVAMKVKNRQMQLKMTMNGMKMFIDTRGKKKEGTGIEFPVRKETPGTDNHENEQAGTEEDLRERMSLNMIILKIFGFDDIENKTQFLEQPDGVTIAFDWDAENNLCIEYKIPMDYIGTPSSLRNKTLSIGWKINEGGDYYTVKRGVLETTTSTTLVSSRSTPGRAGTRGAVPRNGTQRGGSQPETRPGNVEPKGQYVWTKYLVSF